MPPGGKRNFKTKSDAQDAHEAIRPVDVTLTPEDVKPYLAPDQYQVYRAHLGALRRFPDGGGPLPRYDRDH